MAETEGGDRPGPAGRKPAATDPTAFLQSLLPGMAWTQAMIDGPLRAQAALAADTLRQLNAPVVDALEQQRALATSLAAAAEQLSTMAEHARQLASQHAALTEQMQSALEPYLNYVEWLGRVGSGEERPTP